MPIVRLKELTAMSTEDRKKKLAELRAELSRMRTMVSAGGAVENPSRIREIRKTIAQVLTIENQLKAAGATSPSKETKATKPKKPKKVQETKVK